MNDIQLKILELEAQKTGIEAEIEALREIPCPECDGRGHLLVIEAGLVAEEGEEWATKECAACNGTGFVSCEPWPVPCGDDWPRQ